MKSFADLRVLFCAPAGACRGYGHIERSVSFARELGIRPLVAVRGTGKARDVALSLGADVVASGVTEAIRTLRPDVVVVCDPNARVAQKQTAAAKQAGAIVMSIDDLGYVADQDSTVRASARRSTWLVDSQRPLRAAVKKAALSQGN